MNDIGGVNMTNSLSVEAKTNNLEKVSSFVEEVLDKAECPMQFFSKIMIAVDEIASNIVYYAYEEETVGMLNLEIEFVDTSRLLKLIFSDERKPYNPLLAKDPDVSLALSERNPGGLGIFMVKKLMDEVSYEYKDRKNVLTLVKTI